MESLDQHKCCRRKGRNWNFGNKNFLKKKEEGGGAISPQAGNPARRRGHRPTGEAAGPQAGRFNGFIFLIFLFYFFIFLFLVFIYVIFLIFFVWLFILFIFLVLPSFNLLFLLSFLFVS